MSQIRSSLPSLPGNSLRINDNGDISLSVYKGELTNTEIVKQSKKIKDAFPSLPGGFFNVFVDRLKENNFTDQRLKDAVSNVIDTCVYPTPTIANFISFDKLIKIYTHKQVCDMVYSGDKMENYKAIKFNKYPKPVWIHINDVAEYKIESEI